MQTASPVTARQRDWGVGSGDEREEGERAQGLQRRREGIVLTLGL